MNNDADQKPKLEKIIMYESAKLNPYDSLAGPDYEIWAYGFGIGFHSGYELAPALAEIESLRAENAELKDEGIRFERLYIDYSSEVEDLQTERAKLETKLTAATAQMEKMAVALETITELYCNLSSTNPPRKVAKQALAQYEQFKKGSTRE